MNRVHKRQSDCGGCRSLPGIFPDVDLNCYGRSLPFYKKEGEYAQQEGYNTYIDPNLRRTDLPPGLRGGDEDVTVVNCLTADVDIRGPAHTEQKLPETTGDRLVQSVMAEILNDIYEERFLECSYGFRPSRNAHQVVRFINQTIMIKKVNYVLEADIKGFFDNVNHDWMMKFLEHDIADNGDIYSVTDSNTLQKIEVMLSSATEMYEAGCPFHTAMYITRVDGTIGVIYPATDSCDVFCSDGKYYDYGDSDNLEFWSLLGLETDLGDVVLKE